MKELRNVGTEVARPLHGQSTNELIALESEYRTDSLVAAFEHAVDQKAERIGMESLPEAERTLLAVEALEWEVNNGGYGLFFTNSTNEYAPVIVDALNRIGCIATAELTKEAIDALRIEGALTPEAIDRTMSQPDSERDAKLSECDNRYFQYSGDLAAPLFTFIKAHRQSIDLPG